jgi:hypothetical protein
MDYIFSVNHFPESDFFLKLGWGTTDRPNENRFTNHL